MKFALCLQRLDLILIYALIYYQKHGIIGLYQNFWRCIMAKRWSFEEDYIVCTFCRDEYYEHLYDQRLLALMIKLEDAGFGLRSSGAVSKRMNYYLYMFDRFDVSYIPRQCRNISRAL